MNKKLLTIFLFAFLIRLVAINQSLWLDEAITAKVVKNYGFWQLIRSFSPYDFHPPLYYFFIKAWASLFGYSEIALRFPSIIFSLLIGYVIYKIVEEKYGVIVGLWSAAFFLFNPLIVYYSQEARMYMMVTFLLTVCLLFFIKIIQIESSKLKFKNYSLKLKIYLVLFNLFSFLSINTFYGSVFLVAAMILYFIYKRQYQFFFISLFIIIFSLLILLPLLYQQAVNAKVSLKAVPNWSMVLGKANFKNLLLIPLKFFFGRISFYPKWLYWLISSGWTLFILYQILILNINQPTGGEKYIAKIKNICLFYYLVLFSLIAGLIVSFFTPILQYFRFLYLLPIVSILLAYSAKPSLFDRAKIATFLGFFILSLIYLINPDFHREDWKSLAKSIPQGKTVFMIEASSDPLRFYHPEVKIESLIKLSDRSINLNEVWVIPYTADIYRINYQQFLAENKFYLDKTINFRGLAVEIWRKKLKV